MAVFMINICKFDGCGITFPRLGDLIEHIEDVHIDYDPVVVEQKEASQPACIPLSYVLRFFTEATKREFQNMPPVPEVRSRLFSAPKTPSVRSSTPTGSEMDEDEMMSPSEDSNDSWTTVEEYSSEYILRYGVKLNGANGGAGPVGHRANVPGAPQDKPFACPVPGCLKRYKNVNGIKYHSKNGHKKDGKIKKAYKCQCGKSYKTAQGLKSHAITHHIVASSSPPTPAAVTTAPVQTVSAPSADPAPRANAAPLAGLVVTAAPQRPLNIVDGIDGNKLVRIYDSIKAKDLPAFTIPKHGLANVNIVQARPGTGVPAPKDRSPRVTVHPAHTHASYTHIPY
ncbi:hypothetical protein O0L34_g17177 [Tuta absoluta]|nr:hypothetical protein O0L34_g17177 [Tuta absoluta]